MKDKNDILTDIFRIRLKDYDYPVNQDTWDKIEEDLVKIPSRRIIPLRARMIAAAAGIALLIGSGLFVVFHKPAADRPIVKNVISMDPIKSIVEKTDIPQNIAKETAQTPDATAKTRHPEKSETKKNTGSEKQMLPAVNITDNIAETTPTTDPEHTTEKKQNAGENKEAHQKESAPEKSDQSLEPVKTYNPPPVSPAGKKQNLSFALAVGNSGAISSGSADARERLSYSVADIYAPAKFTDKNNIMSENVTYRFPVSVGISVRKHLNEKWALESGLVYTFLSSTETTIGSSNMIPIKKDVRLNYIGWSVKGVYSFYHTQNLSIYLSAGGMPEKCVYAEETFDDGKSDSPHIPELQWSVFGNIGINYRLIDHFGIFLEPGIVYYFDDGSEVKTIRKNSPFNFNLQAGIRLTY
ncbi:MAG: porin family protein [Candidatus Azobacteroides sp.]|nr:porin family protein [Candidatus Azobacteroides sp.]